MKTIVNLAHCSGHSTLYTREVLSNDGHYVAVKADRFSDHGAHTKGAYYLSIADFVGMTGFEVA